jgi:hypothetical protein
MKIEADAKLLTIYVNSTDQWHGQPLYAAIVSHCREQGMAGATVLRASEGYGAGGRLHTAKLMELAENLPVRIEIVDIAERIEPLLPTLEPMLREAVMVISDVRVIRYLQEPSR